MVATVLQHEEGTSLLHQSYGIKDLFKSILKFHHDSHRRYLAATLNPALNFYVPEREQLLKFVCQSTRAGADPAGRVGNRH